MIDKALATYLFSNSNSYATALIYAKCTFHERPKQLVKGEKCIPYPFQPSEIESLVMASTTRYSKTIDIGRIPNI